MTTKRMRHMFRPAISMSLSVYVTSFVATSRQLSIHRTSIIAKSSPTKRQQQLFVSSPKPINLEEPDESESDFGRMAYWDDSYRQEETSSDDIKSESDDQDANVFSWYCGWTDELGPFFEELVPDKESMVLVPGIGNDVAIRDMFDFGGYQRIVAFDYAPQGVESAKAMFGKERLATITNKVGASAGKAKDVFRVCDARDLSGDYGNDTFDAILDKGTFDSIYLSGGKNKEKARENLGMAVSEIKRVLKEDGIVFSVTAACVDAVKTAFDGDKDWEQVRDGSLHMTEDGYASNNVDATMLAWALKSTSAG